jgi:type I restriction enzyme M protein
MINTTDKARFLWDIADTLLRDTFKRGKYQDVILPFTVLRRVDSVLKDTKKQVLAQYAEVKALKLENPHDLLCKASKFAFYNISKYDFERLMDDAPHLADNLRAYINGFSANMREVLEKFDFEGTIARLEDGGLLYLVMDRFRQVDLHPDRVSNQDMGDLFEELIRKFNEALDENPGEHFTPREVVHLMVDLLLAGDEESLQGHAVRTVYDPCCGTGGMLFGAKERVHQMNPLADVHLFGQEVNPETFAICKSDLYLKSADGRDAENIKHGSTLSNPQMGGRPFDYMIANPPYGKDWKKDSAAIEAEHRRGPRGRFAPGLPRISDGQTLFLMDMLFHRKDPEENGSRIAIIMNGSPLFSGDAGSGESEIRRWVIENDWLEAIVALPEQMFYNTGIGTYIWVLSSRKPKARRGKVQMVSATDLWTQMGKSLGNKRRELAPHQIQQIVDLYQGFGENDRSLILDAADLGYRKITVERPMRRNFLTSPERIARVERQAAFLLLAASKKKDPAEKAAEETAGIEQQQAILHMLEAISPTLFNDRAVFEGVLDEAVNAAGIKIGAPLRKAMLVALGERDDTAEICRDAHGEPEPEPDLRDTENVPLKEDIDTFFAREVAPYVPEISPGVPEAWINRSIRDHLDGKVGKAGYEVNFNRYFYRYQPPRPLEDIEADIKVLEDEILAMLQEVTA